MHDDTIRRLREALPPLLTIPQYCKLLSVCEAIAYRDLKTKPGIAVKVGGSTRFVTDVVLDEMARLPAWIPQKDRTPKAKAAAGSTRIAGSTSTAPKKSARSKKQTAAPRREPDSEVRP